MRKRHLYSWRLPWTTAGLLVLLLLLGSSQTVLANDGYLAQDNQPQHKIVTATIRRAHGPYKGPVLVRRDLNGTSISQPSNSPTEPSSPMTVAPTTGDNKQTASATQNTPRDTQTTMISDSLTSTASSQPAASSQTQTSAPSVGPLAGFFSPYSPNQQQDVSKGGSASQQSAQSAFDSSVSSIENSVMNQAFGTGFVAVAAQTVQPSQASASPTVDLQTLSTEQQQSPVVLQASANSVMSDGSSSLHQSSTDSAGSAAASSSPAQSSTGVGASPTVAATTGSRSSNAATTQAATSSPGFRVNGLFAEPPSAQAATSGTPQTQATVSPTEQPTQSATQAVDTTATSADVSTSSQNPSQNIPVATSSQPRVQYAAASGQRQSPTTVATQAAAAPEAVTTSQDTVTSSQDIAASSQVVATSSHDITSQDASQTTSIATQQNSVEAISSSNPYFNPPAIYAARPPTTTATAQYYSPPPTGQSHSNGPISGGDSSSIPGKT